MKPMKKQIKRTSIRRMLLMVLVSILVLSMLGVVQEVQASGDILESEDNNLLVPFSVENMFPGDAVTKDFNIEVSHSKAMTIYYHADIREGYEKLAEVLNTKIELPNKGVILYDGLMRDMPGSLAYDFAAGEDVLLYRITVYLDTSVGNDYQYKELLADFRWWYLEESAPTPTPSDIDPAVVKLTAEKLLDDQYARGDDFTFVLKNESGNVVQTVKNDDGAVDFESLSFSNAGTYIYYISEQPGTDADIVYDDAVYKVIIKVKKETLSYVATVYYEKDGEGWLLLPRFVNITTELRPTEPEPTEPQPTEPEPTQPEPTEPEPTEPKPTEPSPSEPVPTNPEPTEPIKPDNPKTGDESNILLYVLQFGVSLILIILILWKRREEDEDKNENANR